MKDLVSRRAFFKQGAVAALALSSPAFAQSVTRHASLFASGGRTKRVIILGAGMAGLSAAYELAEGRHDVTVLEGQLRAGGRILTLRSPFGEGLFAEAGATRIPDNHEWPLKYVEQFGLPLERFQPADPVTTYHLKGRRFVPASGGGAEWPYPLSAQEKEVGISAIVRRHVDRALNELGDPTRPNWSSAAVRSYDEISFDEFLRDRGVSSGGVELHTALSGGYDFGAVSALWTFRNRYWRHKTQQYFKISGGNDRLPEAFARHLSERIRYGAKVVKIDQDQDRATVTYLRAGAHQVMEADYVICTIPFPVLRHIPIAGLSAEKRRAIAELPYFSVTKVFLQVRRAFWRAQGLSGFALTDLPVQEVWDLAYGQPTSRGILMAYMVGENARRAARQAETERVSQIARSMEEVYPGFKEYFEGGTSKSWDDDPWARGANVYFGPGQMTAFAPIVGKPEGRLHFAGEHTSAWNNWIQGAIESGYRAAEEVNAR